jgi:hypothetical protein
MRAPVHTSADATARLAALAARRRGALVAGAAMLALALAGALRPAAGAVGLAAAIVLWSAAWVTRQMLLEEWLLRDDLAAVPEVARARAELVAPKRRREVARSLRRIAGQRGVSRHEVAPLLLDRVAPVRGELLAVADEVERLPALDPRTMADIARLVHDGARSPLLNGDVPEPELALALRRIRYRLETATAVTAATGREDELRPAA